MMNKISFLWMLGILCLPITNYAEIQVERAKHCGGHRKQCCFKVGPPGLMGFPGISGPPGLPGAIRSLAYGDFYLNLNSSNFSAIAPGESILLQPIDLSRSPQTRIATGVNLDPTTGSITVAVSGVYEINYTVNVALLTPGLEEEVFAPFQLFNEFSVAVVVNSTTTIAGSMRSVQTSSVTTPYIQIHGQVKQSLSAGDSITLINASDQIFNIFRPEDSAADTEFASLQIQNIQPS